MVLWVGEEETGSEYDTPATDTMIAICSCRRKEYYFPNILKYLSTKIAYLL